MEKKFKKYTKITLNFVLLPTKKHFSKQLIFPIDRPPFLEYNQYKDNKEHCLYGVLARR